MVNYILLSGIIRNRLWEHIKNLLRSSHFAWKGDKMRDIPYSHGLRLNQKSDKSAEEIRYVRMRLRQTRW